MQICLLRLASLHYAFGAAHAILSDAAWLLVWLGSILCQVMCPGFWINDLVCYLAFTLLMALGNRLSFELHLLLGRWGSALWLVSRLCARKPSISTCGDCLRNM